jgi:alkylhydroperoxidase family enzyme
MHSKDVRSNGESEQRLYLLNAWAETSLYSPRERAALAWTEAVTRIAETRAPEEIFADVRRHFSAAETVNLTKLIGVINLWNWIAISYRSPIPDSA